MKGKKKVFRIRQKGEIGRKFCEGRVSWCEEFPTISDLRSHVPAHDIITRWTTQKSTKLCLLKLKSSIECCVNKMG